MIEFNNEKSMSNIKLTELLPTNLNESVSPKVLDTYLKTILWAESDETGIEYERGHQTNHFTKKALQTAMKDLKNFFKMAEKYLKPNDPSHEQVAEDFWLARSGRSNGFWEGDYVNGEKLLAIAVKRFGELDSFIDEKGYIDFK